MGAPTVVSKGTVTTTTIPVTDTQPAQVREETRGDTARQLAHDVFAQDASKNPFDNRQGPGLKTIARDTAITTVNAPRDFVNQFKDVFVPQSKASSEER